jgi:hypothetical protein
LNQAALLRRLKPGQSQAPVEVAERPFKITSSKFRSNATSKPLMFK